LVTCYIDIVSHVWALMPCKGMRLCLHFRHTLYRGIQFLKLYLLFQSLNWSLFWIRV